jgi:hypothetical protein
VLKLWEVAMRMTKFCELLGSLAISALLTAAGGAEAKITGFKVTSSKEIGPFAGKPYREVTGMLEGTAPGGAYSVPSVLAFPAKAADFNGFALVDVVNTITVGMADFLPGGQVFPVGRFHMGEDYLFGKGNIYVSALWDKKAAMYLKTGAIAEPGDGIEILRDAASLARDPALAKLAPAVAPAKGADLVIAYGYSQTGALLRGWYANHLNTAAGTMTFDGAIIGAAGGGCYDVTKHSGGPCPEGPVSDGGKTIAFNTEGDAEWGGFVERGQSADYRAFEIAGVSHLPTDLVDFRPHGWPAQNTAGFLPVVRATLENLQAWLKGSEPPPSTYITLKDGPAGSLAGGPYKEAMRDKDGNALGGIRLPHMPGESPGAGAPLGKYTGLALDKQDNRFLLISGAFVPFSKEELLARYPDQETYVKAVSTAAQDLVAERFMLQMDADALVDKAKAMAIGQ